MFEFLDPISLQDITEDEGFKEGQYGKLVDAYTHQEPDWKNADIILLAVHEERGKGKIQKDPHTNAIRKQFYNLYSWHNDIKICDLGNVKVGNQLQDTYVALQSVLQECLAENKTVIILGNGHDLTLAQYYAYSKVNKAIEATCIDAKIDLSIESPFREENFLLEMLTGEPNFVKHYNHIGFQSYFVHPNMMDTLDKLRFDCYRVGKVREKINNFEPIIRSSDLLSIDVNAIQQSTMPCNTTTPNGFAGDEACILMKYAGMSNELTTMGIYNYNSQLDQQELGATQIAQMIWYFIDGRSQLMQEKHIFQKEYYNQFHTAFADFNLTFYQNKITNRWWMDTGKDHYMACSYDDYLQASHNEIPERWLRAQERL
jgi:formiminoglutamase